MRVGRLILGSVVLGAVGTYVYNNASEENKRKVRGYVRKAIDSLPSAVQDLIPSSFRDKLSDEGVTGDVSRSAGPQPHGSTGSNLGGSQGNR